MSQIPPANPYGQAPPSNFAGSEPIQPVRYSALAISGFVLSLLGCLGVTAVLGLIFGIAGIVVTRSGARRGMGLAIAAIPISLITGLFSIVLVLMTFAGLQMMQVAQALPNLYAADGSVSMQAVTNLRSAFSDSFNEVVSDATFVSWLEDLRTKNGSFVEVVDVKQPSEVPGSNRLVINATAKFVSGTRDIAITLDMVSPFSAKVDDIAIGGSSPRPPG